MKVTMFATPSRTIFALPFWVAMQLGYFRDEGIEASLDLIGSGEEIKARLRSGDTVLSIDPADGIFTDVLNGGPLRILGGNAAKPPLFVIAQPEIKTIADMRGKTIGVLSMTEGSVKFLAQIAASAGLTPKDYHVEAVGGAPMRAKLLAERKIDIGLQPMPQNFDAEALGYTNLGWTGSFIPDYQFTTVNANIDWVRREEALAVAILRALLRSQRLALSDPEAVADIAAKEMNTTRAHALKAVRAAFDLGIIDPEFGWSDAGLAKVFDTLVQDNLIEKDTPFLAEQYVVPEYLQQARASLAKH